MVVRIRRSNQTGQGSASSSKGQDQPQGGDLSAHGLIWISEPHKLSMVVGRLYLDGEAVIRHEQNCICFYINAGHSTAGFPPLATIGLDNQGKVGLPETSHSSRPAPMARPCQCNMARRARPKWIIRGSQHQSRRL